MLKRSGTPTGCWMMCLFTFLHLISLLRRQLPLKVKPNHKLLSSDIPLKTNKVIIFVTSLNYFVKTFLYETQVNNVVY